MGTRRVLKTKQPELRPCVAIVTSHSDYYLCWLFGEHLGITWTLFRPYNNCTRYVSGKKYSLIINKNPDGIFLEKHRTIDYLLMVEEYTDMEEVSQLIASIKTLPQITTVFAFPPMPSLREL